MMLNQDEPLLATLVLPCVKVLSKGTGSFHPTADSPCETHYHGTLIDGTVFDSSYDRGAPATFAPNQVSPRTNFAAQRGSILSAPVRAFVGQCV